MNREAAWEEGRKEGRKETLRELITWKMSVGKSVSEVADDLGLKEDEIYQLIQEYDVTNG